MRPLALAALLAVSASISYAQTAGDGVRGTTPPGTSQSGSAPSEGAITGGQPIAPGESGGVPNKDIGNGTAQERLERCYDLTGSLREECLRKERSAAGGSSAPDDKATIRLPRTIETPK